MSRETEAAPRILLKLVVKVTIPEEVPTRETLPEELTCALLLFDTFQLTVTFGLYVNDKE